MQVDLVLAPCEVVQYDLTHRIAVVIDVFRFTTTVLTALESGVEGFYPVREPQEAIAMRDNDPTLLLAGEKHALKIPGFDFGNSPLEHLNRDGRGQRLVCCTTNGTKTVQAVAEANQVVLASLRNGLAVAQYLAAQNQDVLFVPAGTNGRFSLEDTWCAGLIINELPRAQLGDAAGLARLLALEVELQTLTQSEHGMRLKRLEMDEDLAFCLECNVSSSIVLWDPVSGWGKLTKIGSGRKREIMRGSGM